MALRLQCIASSARKAAFAWPILGELSPPERRRIRWWRCAPDNPCRPRAHPKSRQLRRYRRLKNLEALETRKSRFNVNVLELPATLLTELRRLTQETLDDEAERRDLQGVHDRYRAFMQSNISWNAISESLYARALTL